MARTFSSVFSVMGPAGAPMKRPYGSFVGKPFTPFTAVRVFSIIFSVMGPAGAPMKAPYGSFTGKPNSGPGTGTIPHNLHFQVTVGKLKSF